MFGFFVLNCYIEKKDMVGFFFSEFSSIGWMSSPANLYFILFFFSYSLVLECFQVICKCHFSRYSLVSVVLTGQGSVSSPSQVNCFKASYPLSLFLLFLF